jgi:hypothetical protein
MFFSFITLCKRFADTDMRLEISKLATCIGTIVTLPSSTLMLYPNNDIYSSNKTTPPDRRDPCRRRTLKR